MTHSATPLVADQLVDCIANNRHPTVVELFGLAARMWTEASASRSMLASNALPWNSRDRLIALRSAQLALIGSMMVQDHC